jgi:TonB family protein
MPTVILSAVLHVGLAAGLVAMAQNREVKRRAIQVAVTGEKKKEAKPKPPPPPKPIARTAAPPRAAVTPPPSAGPAHVARSAPVATNLAMGNAASGSLDIGPGIGLHGRAEPAAAPAPVKVASAISESRTRRMQQEAAGGDAPCNEEPTKPEPVFKTEINYGVYPQAQQDGIEGKLKLRFTVSETGEVTKVDVLAGIDPGLDAAVVAAAQRWRFKPAMACGKPIAGGTYVFAARFELGN